MLADILTIDHPVLEVLEHQLLDARNRGSGDGYCIPPLIERDARD